MFFYKKLEVRDLQSDDEERRTIPLLRAYTVFHASQIPRVPELGAPKAARPVPERIADADLIVKASGVRVEVGGDRAFYAPSSDHIRMPPDEAFASPARMGRDHPPRIGARERRPAPSLTASSGRFTDKAYAREELRAELASYFVGSALDLPCDVPNHASYVQSWIKVLKSDTREIFRAAADASRIADWILSHHPDHAENRDPGERGRALLRAEPKPWPPDPRPHHRRRDRRRRPCDAADPRERGRENTSCP